MAAPLTRSELRTRIHALAARGGDLTEVRSELDRLLRAAVGYDIAAISTVDPATLLWTSCFVSGLPFDIERERTVMAIEFEGGDLNSYVDLASAPVPVGRLHDASGGRLDRARRWSPLLAPLGVVDEMRVVLRSHDACWGTLTLYRVGDSQPFGAADADAVAEVATPIADLFRLTLLRAALEAPHALDQPPGLLVVAPDGSVDTTSAAATAWLDLLDDRDRLPSAVRSVAAAAQRGDGLARSALPARDGRWVVLHASRLESPGTGPLAAGVEVAASVAVIIEGARPVLVSEVIAGAYGLTPREREVTGLAAQGRSTKQMAAALGLSPFTVQDHLKAVYAKTGVQSRGELVAALFAQQYEPRREAGSTPGPYGWYLDDTVRVAG